MFYLKESRRGSVTGPFWRTFVLIAFVYAVPGTFLGNGQSCGLQRQEEAWALGRSRNGEAMPQWRRAWVIRSPRWTYHRLALGKTEAKKHFVFFTAPFL